MNTLEQLLFHPISGRDAREEVFANTRTFIGDGSPYLSVPGLLELHGVKILHMDLPMEEVREFPKDHTCKRLEAVTMPNVLKRSAADGTPVLLRSVTSNDGLWPKGVDIHVWGEWEPEIEAAPEAMGRLESAERGRLEMASVPAEAKKAGK